MDPFKRLRSMFSQNTHRVNSAVHTGKFVYPVLDSNRAREINLHLRARIPNLTPSLDHPMPRRPQRPRKMASDESAGTGEKDFHAAIGDE
jgi:hypothetical protein